MVSVKDIPKEIIAHFWSSSSEISERTRQKGLQYAFEKYIHNIICHRSNDNENEFKIEACPFMLWINILRSNNVLVLQGKSTYCFI